MSCRDLKLCLEGAGDSQKNFITLAFFEHSMLLSLFHREKRGQKALTHKH